MNRIRAKHREDLLLAILNDVETGVLKGERFTAYDVSRMGAPRAIQIDDDGGGSGGYEAALSDLERLADEGYLEVDRTGQSLDVAILPSARKYRDELRTIDIAK